MPKDKAEVTDSASAGVHSQRTASDEVHTEDSAKAADQRLSDDEITARVNTFLDTKWVGDRRCPICSEVDWHPATTAQLYTFGRGRVGGGGNHYALYVVGCNNCGYALFFNASTAGLFPSQLDRFGEDT